MQIVVLYENRNLRRMKEFKKEQIDSFIGWYMKDESMRKKLVFIIAMSTMMNDNIVYASPNPSEMIDKTGLQVYNTLTQIALYTCLIMCTIELIKASVSKADKNDVTKIVMKYVVIMASVYGLKWFFFWLKGIFNG